MVKTGIIHTPSSLDVVLLAGRTAGEVEGDKGKGKKAAKNGGGSAEVIASVAAAVDWTLRKKKVLVFLL